MTQEARRALKIDVRVDSDVWKEKRKVKAIVRRAVTQAAAALSPADAELAVVLTDDSAIRLLNRRWRGVDAATNVLSFPTNNPGGNPPVIGDIVLAYETIEREARSQHRPFAHHIAHLAVHGFLHLAGYDHERDEDAEKMERLERKILQRLAIPDPYRHVAKTSKRAGIKR
jgi:probable rRNA maturation factor